MQNILWFFILLGLFSCKKKEGCTDAIALNYDPHAKVDDGSCKYKADANSYNPTPFSIDIPELFKNYLPEPSIPSDNPMTVQGVKLGKKLFYDPILSADGSQSCADCHFAVNAFTDPKRFSVGIDGVSGTRNAMPLFNLAWITKPVFFWDGRATSLEDQAFAPVKDPIEMHNSWLKVADDLNKNSTYQDMFFSAFGTKDIDSLLVVKALSQFERTIVSGNAKFDNYLLGKVSLTPQEINGFNVFMDETQGDCFHCHGNPNNPLWTNNNFHNNGLDATFTDKGLGAVTGNANDDGKFRTPTLRNLVYTAPYMHDGRFSTIDEVINHYSEGLKNSATIDPLMKKVTQGGLQLNPQQKADLKAFLLTLTDASLINNPDYVP